MKTLPTRTRTRTLPPFHTGHNVPLYGTPRAVPLSERRVTRPAGYVGMECHPDICPDGTCQ